MLFKKFLILIVLVIGGIWFFFYNLYPYKADFYAKNLQSGMSREKAEEIIPVQIYSRHAYPRSMRRKIEGWRVSWKFSDESILEADFNELTGLKSFIIDKSDTFGGKFPTYILVGSLYLLIAIYLLAKLTKKYANTPR